MLDKIKKIFKNINKLNVSVDEYKNDSIIQSLPTVAYINKAKKLINEKKYDQAQEILNQALGISSQDNLVYKYLGDIAEQKKEYQKAAQYYDKSLKIDSQNREILFKAGMSRLNCGEYEKGLEYFLKADHISPNNSEIKTGIGLAYMKMGKYAFARENFTMAFLINKYNFTAILFCAKMDMKLNDFDSAQGKLNLLIKIAPNEGSLYEYAKLKLIKSDYKEAEKYAKKILEINKQMLPAYFILAEIYSLKKDKANTEKIFKTAIDNGLDSSETHFEWGKAYMRIFEYEKAKEQFQLAINAQENSTDAKIGLALVNSYENNFELLDQLKEQNGENVYIQEAIGLKRLFENKITDAIEMFKKALRTDPLQTLNYLHIARAYAKLPDIEKTKDYYDKFLIENPQMYDVITEYAIWLAGNNDFSNALRKLRKIEKIHPDDVQILNLIFLCLYHLVKENISEYNIKEALNAAKKVKTSGKFEHPDKEKEIENILKNIQENK